MGQRSIPVIGGLYRHFKGNLYQVIGIAKHTETEEDMVVYQALYGDFGLWVRPLSEFVSPVDRNKYPSAVQEYRFERVVPEAQQSETQKKERTSDVEKISEEVQQEETFIRAEILRFLDAEGAAEKLSVLREVRTVLDDELVTTMELSLDILPDDKESLERRIGLIEWTLEQRVRYEGGRLR